MLKAKYYLLDLVWSRDRSFHCSVTNLIMIINDATYLLIAPDCWQCRSTVCLHCIDDNIYSRLAVLVYLNTCHIAH